RDSTGDSSKESTATASRRSLFQRRFSIDARRALAIRRQEPNATGLAKTHLNPRSYPPPVEVSADTSPPVGRHPPEARSRGISGGIQCTGAGPSIALGPGAPAG